MIKVDTALYWMRKTVGYLSENDRLMRSNLPVTVLEGAINLLVQLKDPFVDWQLLALLNKAAYGIQRAEFAESLTLSWSVAETIIEFEWVNYIESTNQSIEGSEEKTINSERRRGLMSVDYTASQRAEILELAKVIPFDLYKRSTKARKSRNEWLHKLRAITQQECRASFLVARDFLARKLQLPLEHPGGFYTEDEHFRDFSM